MGPSTTYNHLLQWLNDKHQQQSINRHWNVFLWKTAGAAAGKIRRPPSSLLSRQRIYIFMSTKKKSGKNVGFIVKFWYKSVTIQKHTIRKWRSIEFFSRKVKSNWTESVSFRYMNRFQIKLCSSIVYRTPFVLMFKNVKSTMIQPKRRHLRSWYTGSKQGWKNPDFFLEEKNLTHLWFLGLFGLFMGFQFVFNFFSVFFGGIGVHWNIQRQI